MVHSCEVADPTYTPTRESSAPSTPESSLITRQSESKMETCGCKASCEDLQRPWCTSLTYNQIPASPLKPSKPWSAGFVQRQRRTTHVWSGTALADAISGEIMNLKRIRSFLASRPALSRMACASMLPSRPPLS
jgi:hypothetical protein